MSNTFTRGRKNSFVFWCVIIAGAVAAGIVGNCARCFHLEIAEGLLHRERRANSNGWQGPHVFRGWKERSDEDVQPGPLWSYERL